MEIQQQNFADGIDLINSDTDISSNGYRLLFNARTRFGKMQPTKKHLEDTNAPAGLKQGIASIGDVTIIFVAGLAYYKYFNDPVWHPVPSFGMSPFVKQYYTQVVPDSNFNFVRKLNATGNINAGISVVSTFIVAGTPSGLLVQDGENQPWIITFDPQFQIVSARVTKNYTEWANISASADDREYVPIGMQMMFLNAILFIVSADGQSVYRSVSGRPLDFMVNVDVNGNKLPSEVQGGAATISFAFDFNEITCLYPTSIADTFIYGTNTLVRLISLDYTNTVFGEPTFREAAKIETGLVNQSSVVEILGDYAMIDFEGVKRFNAVQQLKWEGKNDPFSLQISKILNGKRQSLPASVMFDNYAMFGLDTEMGYLVAVYDSLLDKWASLDITLATKIRQFAIVKNDAATKLYAITTTNKVFQMFGSEDSELGVLFTRAWRVSPQVEHKSQYLKLTFLNGIPDNERVRVVEYVDDRISQSQSPQLPSGYRGINYPVRPPVIPSNKPGSNTINFPFKDGLGGYRIAFSLSWQTDAELNEIYGVTGEQNNQHSLQQGNKQLVKQS